MLESLPLEAIATAAFLAFCRIGACFMIMPGLSSARVPLQVRLFVAIAATWALLAHLWDAILPFTDRRPDNLLLLVASELLVGGLMGLVARLYMLALEFIGSVIAMNIGYGGMLGSSIEDNEPQSALGAIISFSALLLLFVLDFHHQIVRALVSSYQAIPIEALFDPRGSLVDVTDTLRESFYIMMRLGSPFVAYAILVNLATGFVNKLTPQIPVYFISLPFVIAGGLTLLYFGITTFLSLAMDGFIPTTIGR
ncbi:flagellar biosynthetic protein FliR [Aquamicrobium sp. LC103]|uniref:flagellar biosynthetic protein FliR n=1 Tax=Aquamicrobium sp. LC103 TaxID=1120658 RepID=UPI00063E83CF|nr:flagellar biosynthetic protein FliR [Aquamicrobium sp. LC103]TKT77506.1 flagellar type III secretion system protein FliR [Aquamicrobium sp. LC103]